MLPHSAMMLRLFAPIARRMPIARVRPVTETSMMPSTKGFLFCDRACYAPGMIVSSDPMTEAEILTAVVGPDKPDLPAESARAILELRFGQPAIDRLNELAEKNRQGTLSEMERNELDSYLRVGNFLNLMQAKARNSLVHAS